MEWNVKNARNTDVERQHLNKILAEISAAIVKVERQANIVKDVESAVAGMLTGQQYGIHVFYDATQKALNFKVKDFTIRLIGDVTGSGTVSGLSDVTLVTSLASDVGISDAPNDGAAYWRRALAWEEIPVLIEQLASLEDNGLLVATDTGIEAREIEGTAGNIEVVNGDGVDGNPTIDLADLADNGTGELVAIDRDVKGRVEGMRPVNPSDIPSPFAMYLVDGDGNYLVDEAGNYLIAGDIEEEVFDMAATWPIVIDSIADGDTTHAPSRNSVFDALALKMPNALVVAGTNVAYTYVAADANVARGKTTSTARTYTVDASVLTVGAFYYAANYASTGDVTIVPFAGTTLREAGASVASSTVGPFLLKKIWIRSATEAWISPA